MPQRHQPDEERELQELLRNAGAAVLLGLFVVIVLVVLLTPFLSDRVADTTLLLGLASSALGAFLALVGVQLRMRSGD